jgi:hypothetical protein
MTSALWDPDHTLSDLTDHLLAVIDDPTLLTAAVNALLRAGSAAGDVVVLSGHRGLDVVDANGDHSGRLKRVLRTLQHLNRIEARHLQDYEAALRAGGHVIGIRLHHAPEHQPMLDIVAAHGGRLINAYHALTVEELKA